MNKLCGKIAAVFMHFICQQMQAGTVVVISYAEAAVEITAVLKVYRRRSYRNKSAARLSLRAYEIQKSVGNTSAFKLGMVRYYRRELDPVFHVHSTDIYRTVDMRKMI